jgi:hypothetical protein
MSELPAASSETDYSNYGPLELVATDSKGPFATQSNFGHFKYFDLFSYKSSHWMSARFKKAKDEVYKNIVAEIKLELMDLKLNNYKRMMMLYIDLKK